MVKNNVSLTLTLFASFLSFCVIHFFYAVRRKRVKLIFISIKYGSYMKLTWLPQIIKKRSLLVFKFSNLRCAGMEQKLSRNSIHLKEWMSKGNTIPTCINDGCNNQVAIRHWSAQGDPSLKTECSRCSDARKKDKAIEGVTFHKKKYCENNDGVLGFFCPMDKDRYTEFPSDIYHMDHLDGNHHNNTLENLKTFCAICHTRKGRESGDFNAFKSSSRIHKP